MRFGVPAGTIRITGSPGLSSTHKLLDSPISNTMVDTIPAFGEGGLEEELFMLVSLARGRGASHFLI